MNFNLNCSVCGGPNKPDAIKCVFCKSFLEHAPVLDNLSQSAAASHSETKDEPLFCRLDWAAEWKKKRAGADALGLILTNTADADDTEALDRALKAYIEHRAQNGVTYCVLDLKTQCVDEEIEPSCEDIVSLLTQIYEEAVPNYLLIIGDSSVIPSIVWDNESPDDDANVPSDLPYITLDTESPWSGKRYDFDDITQVGRIPASAKNGFKHAVSYLENTVTHRVQEEPTAFAYSAIVWEKTSRTAFLPLGAELVTSPKYTSDPDRVPNGLQLLDPLGSRYNLLCFNLHGSDASHAWYGEWQGNYPEAFNKSLLPDGDRSYVICTEACYGARPKVNARGEQGIVVNALSNGCLAFVGSSRIAYGMSDGRMSCADVIANTFTKGVTAGMTVGAAFLKALSAVGRGDMDEIDIKTLAEFALYGDPCEVLVRTQQKKSANGMRKLSISKPARDESRAITLLSCSDSGITPKNGGFTLMSFDENERAKIQTMSHSIRETGKAFVLSNFSEMKEVEPTVYKVMGKAGYRAVYSKQQGPVKTVVNMHLDDLGHVQKIYTSK